MAPTSSQMKIEMSKIQAKSIDRSGRIQDRKEVREVEEEGKADKGEDDLRCC